MTYFVVCHKEVADEETEDLFIDNCYELNVVPKAVDFDRNPHFVGTFYLPVFYEKIEYQAQYEYG